MARRQIIEIDEAKCDGCGRCVPACAEGALRIVNGKARLVSDTYCDGLGACLGECPRGAISMVEREAEPFEIPEGHTAESAVPGRTESPCSRGCPGSTVRNLQLEVLTPAEPQIPQPSGNPSGGETPALCHWPIQLHLVPASAPFLRDADLFLVADCVPFACAGFHTEILRARPVVIGCPKLDQAEAYVEKLAAMLRQSAIQSLTVVHMEVPCCTNLVRIANKAIGLAGRPIPLHKITITLGGEIEHET
jgi:Pyruvate/2-oxoacid:ferredoxin oxidoreductase delta subunit